MRLRSPASLSTAVLLAACNGNAPLQAPTASPAIATAKVLPNPNNVLSALITFEAEGDSARVVYAGKNLPPDSTPFTSLHQGADTIAILGLRPSTTYRSVIQVASGAGLAGSDTLNYTTENLPDLLRRITITTTGAGGSNLTLTSAQVGGDTVVAFAFDSSGAIRWYRRFPGKESVSGDLKQQPNGDFTLYRGLSYGSQHVPGEYIEFTPAGDSIRAITVATPSYLDNHELLMSTGSDGKERLHFFEYEHRPVNLAFVGVAAEIPVAGHQLVRLREDGTTEFEWNAWDHIAPEEWIEPPPPDPINPGEPDYDHPNSLTFDRDGNYVVSFRHLGQIMKINSQSGEIMWRLGGTKNQFTFRDDPLNGFSAQHSARIMANGNLLLYDNGTRHNPPESRAVEYALDTTAMTATLVWQFRHSPIIYTPYVGLVQRLANGNTSIAYAQAGHVTEVSGAGTVLWEADVRVDGNPAFCYRLSRIVSLYRYQTP
jgi:Arylsulfotransferase (ASST)